jgi:hypothetical protein
VAGQQHKGFRWIDGNHNLYQVDRKTGVISKQTLENETISLGPIPGWAGIAKELPDDFDVNFFEKGNDTLVTVPGTGHLYKLSLDPVKLTRLDRTYFRGYNFNATQFFRNDTLISAGGRGFWSKNSIITFYNTNAGEWDLYVSYNDNIRPSLFGFTGYSRKHDAFFSSYYQDDELSRGDKIPMTIFDFKKREWRVMGNLADNITDYIKFKHQLLWLDEYVLIYVEGSPTKVYLVNPLDNKSYVYSPKSQTFFLEPAEIYFKNGYLYSRLAFVPGKSDRVILDSLSLNDIIKSSVYAGPAYNKLSFGDYKKLLLSAIFILIVFASFVYYKWKRKNSLQVTEDEIKILKLLLNNSQSKFTTNQLNEILGIDKRNYATQRKIRNDIINNLNQKFINSLGEKELLCRTPNADDKRMTDYFINPNLNPKEIELIQKVSGNDSNKSR